jgi:hypothetical protein
MCLRESTPWGSCCDVHRSHLCHPADRKEPPCHGSPKCDTQGTHTAASLEIRRIELLPAYGLSDASDLISDLNLRWRPSVSCLCNQAGPSITSCPQADRLPFPKQANSLDACGCAMSIDLKLRAYPSCSNVHIPLFRPSLKVDLASTPARANLGR